MHNRVILFRGKRSNNGEWVYGSPIFQDGYALIRFWNSEEFEYEEYLVIPNTVGQYTGLTDKNGKRIFEGDILAFSDRLVYVHWHDYCGCWDCSYIKAVKGKAAFNEDRSPNKWRYNAEVIGNIYDNPELLEGGEQR